MTAPLRLAYKVEGSARHPDNLRLCRYSERFRGWLISEGWYYVGDLPDGFAAAPPVVTAPLPAPDRHGEWHHGHAQLIGAGPGAVAYTEPDPDGDTVYFRQLGWTAAELPDLVAWLQAVIAATTPDTDGVES